MTKDNMTNFNSKMENLDEEQLRHLQGCYRKTLKALYKEQAVVDEEKLRIKLHTSDLETRLRAINKKLASLPYTDGNYDRSNVRISDHAVLRYMERVLKFDVEGIRAEILHGFPEKLPIGADCAKIGKTIYHFARDKDKLIVTTIINRARRPRTF